MTIIQVPQGYAQQIVGQLKDEVIAQFTRWEAEFLVKFPECVRYHRQGWQEFEAPEAGKAPWGHEWYVVDADGRVQFHSADYDTSG